MAVSFHSQHGYPIPVTDRDHPSVGFHPTRDGCHIHAASRRSDAARRAAGPAAVRVRDVTHAIAGPTCAKTLAPSFLADDATGYLAA